MATGKQIKHYRDKAGWKLKELSARCDVDIGTLSALEIRDSSRSEFFQKIAAAFGLTLEQLADESTDYDLTLEPLPAVEPHLRLVAIRTHVSDFAKVLADTFDCLPDDLELRSAIFTRCMALIKAAKSAPRSAPPAPSPSQTETSEKQP